MATYYSILMSTLTLNSDLTGQDSWLTDGIYSSNFINAGGYAQAVANSVVHANYRVVSGWTLTGPWQIDFVADKETSGYDAELFISAFSENKNRAGVDVHFNNSNDGWVDLFFKDATGTAAGSVTRQYTAGQMTTLTLGHLNGTLTFYWNTVKQGSSWALGDTSGYADTGLYFYMSENNTAGADLRLYSIAATDGGGGGSAATLGTLTMPASANIGPFTNTLTLNGTSSGTGTLSDSLSGTTAGVLVISGASSGTFLGTTTLTGSHTLTFSVTAGFSGVTFTGGTMTAVTVPSFTTANMVNRGTITGTLNSGGAAVTLHAGSLTIGGQGTCGAFTIATATNSAGTTASEGFTLTLSSTLTNGIPPGVTQTLIGALGAGSNSAGNSAAGTITIGGTSNTTPFVLVATYEPTGAHSVSVTLSGSEPLNAAFAPWIGLGSLVLSGGDLGGDFNDGNTMNLGAYTNPGGILFGLAQTEVFYGLTNIATGYTFGLDSATGTAGHTLVGSGTLTPDGGTADGTSLVVSVTGVRTDIKPTATITLADGNVGFGFSLHLMGVGNGTVSVSGGTLTPSGAIAYTSTGITSTLTSNRTSFTAGGLTTLTLSVAENWQGTVTTTGGGSVSLDGNHSVGTMTATPTVAGIYPVAGTVTASYLDTNALTISPGSTLTLGGTLSISGGTVCLTGGTLALTVNAGPHTGSGTMDLSAALGTGGTAVLTGNTGVLHWVPAGEGSDTLTLSGSGAGYGWAGVVLVVKAIDAPDVTAQAGLALNLCLGVL